MHRVVITRAFNGIAGMQVCAALDATDEEILAVCNAENPSGTELGWCRVIRKNDPERGLGEQHEPITCANDAGRLHFLVTW